MKINSNVDNTILFLYLKEFPIHSTSVSSIFLQKCIFFMTGTCKFGAKNSKINNFQTKLFGNFYSTLNFLSNDIQYVKLFTFKFFLETWKFF